MRRFYVSVIIPVYNGAETIKDALNSVLRQTALRYVQEVIVVDDGSTDDTVKTVLDWKEKNSRDVFKLVLIELKENRGVSAARNKGVESSAGNYIAFLDADDDGFGDLWRRRLIGTEESSGNEGCGSIPEQAVRQDAYAAVCVCVCCGRHHVL